MILEYYYGENILLEQFIHDNLMNKIIIYSISSVCVINEGRMTQRKMIELARNA